MLRLLKSLYYRLRGFSLRSLRNEVLLTQALKAGTEVNWLASYPRSGNTWTRLVTADYLLRANGFEDYNLQHEVSRIIPDFAQHDIQSIGFAGNALPLIIKTHDNCLQLSAKYDKSESHKVRCVCLFRNPEDVLTSFFHYRHRGIQANPSQQNSIDQFVLNHLDSWVQHIQSYLNHDPSRTFFLAYEKLISDPLPYFSQLLGWYGIKTNQNHLQAAIDSNTFAKLRHEERKHGGSSNSLFYRRGRSGGGLEELSNKTLERVWSSSSSIYAEAVSRMNN